ncbi:MAG: hypothetical protein JSR96_13955 [Proteobacteria bacterium]|nr:hypothetical protein [Pseudomonadota bacterium]
MPRPIALICAGILAPALGGCVAGTLVDVATAPVRVASGAVDMATTSQSEADEHRGRELRKREERYGQLQRDYAHQARECRNGNAKACTRRDALAQQIDTLRPQVPAAAY